MNAVAVNFNDFGIHEPPLTREDNCVTHGEFESRCRMRNIWSKCPACASENKRAAESNEAAKARTAEVEHWQRQLGKAEIPIRFKDRTLASYKATTSQQQKALSFAQQYADGFDAVRKSGRGALFVGKPGTGKTHLAVGIALEVMGRWNGTALFTTAMRALRRVKDTWTRESEESETQAIGALVFPDLLILDEVGVQFGSDTEKLILFEVLNERYEQRKPSILMSNLTTNEVRDYLGERIFDRMREDGGQVRVFDWESYRGQSGDQDGGK